MFFCCVGEGFREPLMKSKLHHCVCSYIIVETLSSCFDSVILHFSLQGGLICRALLATTPDHNVHTFISLASPQAGQYGGQTVSVKGTVKGAVHPPKNLLTCAVIYWPAMFWCKLWSFGDFSCWLYFFCPSISYDATFEQFRSNVSLQKSWPRVWDNVQKLLWAVSCWKYHSTEGGCTSIHWQEAIWMIAGASGERSLFHFDMSR